MFDWEKLCGVNQVCWVFFYKNFTRKRIDKLELGEYNKKWNNHSQKERMSDMKKFLATLLAAAMLCMGLPTFALTEEDFNAAMNADISSAQIKMTMKAEVTEMDKDVLQNIAGVELDAMPSATFAYDMVMVTNPEATKMQMKMDVTVETVPAVDLLDQVLMTSYIDFDITDPQAPVYKVILKTPDNEKYQVLDYTKLPGSGQMMEQITSMLESMSPENVEELNQQFAEFLPEVETEYKDNTATVTMNDEQIKEYIAGAMQGMKEVFGPTLSTILQTSQAQIPGVTADSPIDLTEQAETIIANIGTALKEVPLFAEDGLTASVTLDETTKQLQEMDCVIKIDTNLNELVSKVGTAVGMTEEELAPALEMLPVDKADFKGQLSMNMAFSNINDEELTVEFPELTEENAINLTEQMMIDINAVNIFYNGMKVEFPDEQPVIEDNRTLVPIRHFCNAIGISDDDIQYDDGVVTIKNGDTTITMTIGQQEVTIVENGETKNVTLDVPAIERNGRTLIPLRFISENFGCTVSYEEYTDSAGNITGSLVTVVPNTTEQ